MATSDAKKVLDSTNHRTLYYLHESSICDGCGLSLKRNPHNPLTCGLDDLLGD